MEVKPFVVCLLQTILINLLTKQQVRRLRQAMIEYNMGLDPDNLSASIIKDGDYFAFIELHIEQGKYLLNKKIPLAIIDDIAGIRQFYITYNGESAHAGGMAMEDRHDAMAAAAATACKVEQLAINSEINYKRGRSDIFMQNRESIIL